MASHDDADAPDPADAADAPVPADAADALVPADGGLDLDLLAGSLRADMSDLRAFVEALAVKLEEAVPTGVRVYRWRARLFGPKRVGKITLDAGDQRLELRADGDRVQTRCSRLSGGIVLKSEELDTEAWLVALTRALGEQARRSETTRRALERLLNG